MPCPSAWRKTLCRPDLLQHISFTRSQCHPAAMEGGGRSETQHNLIRNLNKNICAEILAFIHKFLIIVKISFQTSSGAKSRFVAFLYPRLRQTHVDKQMCFSVFFKCAIPIAPAVLSIQSLPLQRRSGLGLRDSKTPLSFLGHGQRVS